MVYVSVLIKGTSTGTITDMDGKFSLKMKEKSKLLISFIGYDPKEVDAAPGDVINLKLSVKSTNLDEVLVIGYGTVKKNDATGSVTSVSSKDFNKGAITSAQDLLVGKSAGVVITTSGGAPGSGATIRVRGGSSLNASNDPLIIIDGVPIDNSSISGSSNPLSLVNPNDIETFTVLKDASATAIYGSRASNGVILITTKKGKEGSPMKITYDGNVSVGSAIKFVDVYSGDQVREIAWKNRNLYGVSTLNTLGSANTDWQKEIFRTAVSSDHNVSLSGAYKMVPYRLSIGYTDQNGILKNTDMQRTTAAFNVSPTLFNKSLTVTVNGKFMNTDQNFGDDGAIGSAINMDPTQPVMDGNAKSAGYYQWVNYGASLGTANPVEQAMVADNKANVKRFLGNVQLNYQIPFIPELRANLNVATDYQKSIGHNNRPTTSPSVLINPLAWGKVSNFTGKNYNNLIDFYLNYNKDIKQIASKIDLTGGYSWQHFQREKTSYTHGIVDADHKYQMSDSSSSVTENYLVSFFGRLNYTIADRYLLTFTVRNDGSSRFIQHWGLFPSAAFAWKVKDEFFLKNVPAVTDLKLRFGWGVTGQQDIADNDYPAQALYKNSSAGSYYPIGGVYQSTLRPNSYDPNIKWEQTTTRNIGLDFGIFKDILTGSVDLYNRQTKDLINQVTVPSGSNFSNKLYTNVGSLENNGVEVALNLRPISTKDMDLNISYNFTYNKNKITKLESTEDPNYQILIGDAMTGIKQVTMVGYPANSFYVNKQVYDSKGNPIEGVYVDQTGGGGLVNSNTKNQYIYHNPVADYLMGLSARFRYKNFDLSASSRISIGNYVYNQVAAGASLDQMSQIGYWKNFTGQLSNTNFVKRQFTSDYFVENASFFKLDNVSAGYKFDNINNTKIGARLSFTVQNVFTATKYTGIDPEVGNGIDNNTYPRPRTFILGVSLTY